MSWVFGPGGTTATPGGADKDIQFNNHGSFSGSALLITDGTGSLSASVNISASAFYGDGSNLTGLTASAVNVADGPEFSLQFRRNHPVSGEISGNVLLMSDGAGAISASSNISASNFYLTPGKSIFFDGNAETFKITNNGTNLDINGANIILNAGTQVSASSNLSASQLYATTLNLTNNAVVLGQVIVGQGTGNGYVSANGDSDTRIRFAADGRGTDSMSIEAGGKAFITLDENGRDELILGDASGDIVHVSGSLTASVGMRVSASVANGQDIFVGSGTTRTIGVVEDSGDDFFLIGNDAGTVTLSASSGVEFIGGSHGVGSFGSDINVYATQAGSTNVASLSKSGRISGSGDLIVKGKVTLGVSPEQTTNFSASVVGSFRTFIVNSTGSVITGTLPGITSHADVGLIYTFKDIAGSGSTNNVVVEPSGSQKIDGARSAKIQTNYGALTVTAFSSSFGGFNWGIVSTT